MSGSPTESAAANRAERTGTAARPPRRLLAKLALFAASVIAALAVGEVAVWVLKPQQLLLRRPDIYHPVDTLGWAYRPNVSTTINTGERTVRLFTDSLGFRIGEAGRPEADIDVLILGDSFMAALQVEYEQSISGLLEVQLSRSLGRPVTVWNGGIEGWQPSQYLLRAERMLPTGIFDVVLVALFVANDVVSQHRSYFPPREPHSAGFRVPRRLSAHEIIEGIFIPLTDLGHAHSHLFTLAWLSSEWARSKRLAVESRFPPVFLEEYAARPDWDVTADICAEIAALGRTHGAQTVFLLVPAALQINERLYASRVRSYGVDTAAVDMDQPNRLLGAALRSRGLTVVDPLEGLRAAHAAGTPVHGSLDLHFTAEGNEVAQALVAPVLLQHLSAGEAGPAPRPSADERGE